MAKFENDELGVRFTLPDNPTVGQQLRYRGRVFATGYFTEDVYLRMWLGFLGLYSDWESESVPDPKAVDLETETDPAVADVVQWVGNVTARHMNTLEAVPKN